MSRSDEPRLASRYIEDLIEAALRRQPVEGEWGPQDSRDIAARRIRLRARIKQVGRHDWPDTLASDPALRRGYTIRQCLRLVTVFCLLEAHLPPTLAVRIARDNEAAFLKAIASKLHPRYDPHLGLGTPGYELVAVLIASALNDIAPAKTRDIDEPNRVRLLHRADLACMWGGDFELPATGQRLVIDVAAAADGAWAFIAENGRLPFFDLMMLLDQAEKDRDPTYLRTGHVEGDRYKRRSNQPGR